jgi:hypothetical protein
VYCPAEGVRGAGTGVDRGRVVDGCKEGGLLRAQVSLEVPPFEPESGWGKARRAELWVNARPGLRPKLLS